MPDSAAPPAVATARPGHRRWAIPAFVAGIVVLAFNLRGSITSLPPLFPELSSSLHLSPAAIAALAATPVLCFGVFSGVAAPLSRRYGEERVLLVALALLGIYLLSLAAGAILGSLLAVPLFLASGGSVPLALGIWALPVAAAVLAWLPQWRFRTAPAGTPRPAQRRLLKVSRYLLAWQVMGFMGLQSLI